MRQRRGVKGSLLVGMNGMCCTWQRVHPFAMEASCQARDRRDVGGPDGRGSYPLARPPVPRIGFVLRGRPPRSADVHAMRTPRVFGCAAAARAWFCTPWTALPTGDRPRPRSAPPLAARAEAPDLSVPTTSAPTATFSQAPPPPVPPYLAISHMASPINGLSPQTSTPQVVSVKLSWPDRMVLGHAAFASPHLRSAEPEQLVAGVRLGRAWGCSGPETALGVQARAIRPKLVTTHHVAIRSIRHSALRRWFVHGNASRLHPAHAERIKQILDALDDASPLEDLSEPTYRLHPLKGDRRGPAVGARRPHLAHRFPCAGGRCV